MGVILHGAANWEKTDIRRRARALQQVVKEGYLRCVVGREKAILNTDVTFLAVGTPSQSDGSIELQLIENSALEIGQALGKKQSGHLARAGPQHVPQGPGYLRGCRKSRGDTQTVPWPQEVVSISSLMEKVGDTYVSAGKRSRFLIEKKQD